MRRWATILVLLIVLPCSVIVLGSGTALADTDADITVTVVGWVGGDAPSGFTLTYVSDFEIGISWTKGTAYLIEPPGTDSVVVNTMIRVKWGEPPTSRIDGYQVYYGDASNYADNNTDLTSLTQTPYYRAWSETVFYDAGGDIISSVWEEIGTWEEANFMSVSWFTMILLLGALGLTCTMFVTKQGMIGFAAALFWALFGGYVYTLSVTAWDIYFLVAFGSLLGMVTFTTLGAYGLREKRDTIADEEMEKGEGEFVDETSSRRNGTAGRREVPSRRGKIPSWQEEGISPRRAALRERAARRRGEFSF